MSHALVILGLQSVKTLVLGFSLVRNLQKQKSKGFNHLDYWRRSIYAATAAKTLAAKTQMVQAEECFLAALLQDIGMLVLDQVLDDRTARSTAKAATHRELAAAGADGAGGDARGGGGVLADEWKLPPLLAMPMRHHHDPQAVEDAQLRKLADVGYVARLVRGRVRGRRRRRRRSAEVRKYCMDHFKMPEADATRC